MDNQLYLNAAYQKGIADATDLQQRSAEVTGTALYSEADKIPSFAAAVAKMNMLNRPVGFVCRSSAGRVVKLLQVYDSTVYTGEPEEIPAQWGFKWSTDPSKALPFIQLATSPYGKGDCCTEGGKVWRSLIDSNVHAPSAYPQGWQEVTEDSGVVEPTEPTEPTEPEQPPEYVQPTGGQDAYKIGDRVTYNGKVYESTINNNVWTPDAYPQGWRLV